MKNLLKSLDPEVVKILKRLLIHTAEAAITGLVSYITFTYMDPGREAKNKAKRAKKELTKRLGRRLINTNEFENNIALDVANPDDCKVEFHDIGGLDSIKEELYDLVILPLRRPELFSSGKLLTPQKGVLLYGPPGTGKTMLAKAIAKESGAVFINVKSSSVNSKWFGEAQKHVAAIFSLAQKLQPAIIFIDEVDSFLGKRHDMEHQYYTEMKTEFMSLWDGFTTDKKARVMVLGATNRPSQLDDAILRRFTQCFEVALPSSKERAKILEVILKDEKVDGIDYDGLASLCDKYSGSDLLELCKKAAYLPIKKFLNDEKIGKPSKVPNVLSQKDLEKVIATFGKTKNGASEYNKVKPEERYNKVQPFTE